MAVTPVVLEQYTNGRLRGYVSANTLTFSVPPASVGDHRMLMVFYSQAQTSGASSVVPTLLNWGTTSLLGNLAAEYSGGGGWGVGRIWVYYLNDPATTPTGIDLECPPGYTFLSAALLNNVRWDDPFQSGFPEYDYRGDATAWTWTLTGRLDSTNHMLIYAAAFAQNATWPGTSTNVIQRKNQLRADDNATLPWTMGQQAEIHADWRVSHGDSYTMIVGDRDVPATNQASDHTHRHQSGGIGGTTGRRSAWNCAAIVVQPHVAFTEAVDGSIDFVGALGSFSIYKVLAGAITPAGTIVGKALKQLAGAITPAGTVVKKTALSFAGAISFTGALIKKALKQLAGAITPAGVVTAFKRVLVSIAVARRRVDTEVPAKDLDEAVERRKIDFEVPFKPDAEDF